MRADELSLGPSEPSPPASLDVEPGIVAGAGRVDETQTSGEGQALDSDQVIELQAFSERKAWIEEKVKLLEQMPHIEIFAGLDALRSSAEDVPGLPTRAQLQQWLVEHDKIEKETEVFDTGEFRELKKFTKAATQRNLSPEDTDLIELTLTTIYALDKLLHLLRDRSENLDLLGLRLKWEENRVGAWIDRRKIIADLQVFLYSRARWSPSAYETTTSPEVLPKRRGSVASVVSVASFTSSDSSNILSSPGFSRSSRFKLAELLSRDAAQFGARVTAMKHGKITPGGKILDKFIESSRIPVPEELLDEQDRLEDMADKEMENIGKFAMSIVMQWKKADEIYVETMKDQVAAQTLIDELELASLQHPTARQDNIFTSRADVILKRLSLRGNPFSLRNVFLRPAHPLFLDQDSANTAIADELASELKSAWSLAKSAEANARDYHASLEAVKRVEAARKDISALAASLESLVERLEGGVHAVDGDGKPPDLSSEACLDPMRHSTFLALLPLMLDELKRTDHLTDAALRNARAALLGLQQAGVDPQFKVDTVAEIEQCAVRQEKARRIRDDVVACVARLHDARRVWAAMIRIAKLVDELKRNITEAMDRGRWRQQPGRNTAPLVPENPRAPLSPCVFTPSIATQTLDDLHATIAQEITLPLSHISTFPDTSLLSWLGDRCSEIAHLVSDVKSMTQLWEAIRQQTAAMTAVRDEMHDFENKVDALTVRLDTTIQDVLMHVLQGDDLLDATLTTDVDELTVAVQAFLDTMSGRVPFVARCDPSQSNPNCVPRRFSLSGSGETSLGLLLGPGAVELPFDLVAVDAGVRADSNSYAISLAGGISLLEQKTQHLRLAKVAKEVDDALQSIVESIHSASQDLARATLSFETIQGSPDLACQLLSLRLEHEMSVQKFCSTISRSFSVIRDLLREMDDLPGAHDACVHEVMLVARNRAVDDAQLRFEAWVEHAASLTSRLVDAERVEAQRVEEERIVEEDRLQVERERLAAGKKARLEAEEQAKVKQERFEAEEKARLQQALLEAGEMERVERERWEAEESTRIEQERLEIEGKDRIERDRLDAEEKARLEQERLNAEEKLRQEQERFEAESRDRFEQEHLDAEEQAKRKEDELSRMRRDSPAVDERAKLERNNFVSERLEADNLVKLQAAMPHAVDEEDVFGRLGARRSGQRAMSQAMIDLQSRISSLRKLLRSMDIHGVARPGPDSSSSLPSLDQHARILEEFTAISTEVKLLPGSAEESSVDSELRSLRSEVEKCANLVKRVGELAELVSAVALCDLALSDLLEHIDSYPATPTGALLSSHVSSLDVRPEEQLSTRLSFTEAAIKDMEALVSAVKEDPSVISELERIGQTWSELKEMATDRIEGAHSPSVSAVSSGRNSRTSVNSLSSSASKRMKDYSALGRVAPSSNRFLMPSAITPRRAVSGSSDHRRSSSKMTTASTSRSVSGPFDPSKSTLYSTTFASRQRTTSLSSSASALMTPIKNHSLTPSRRPQTGQAKRRGSPTFSDVSSHSHLSTRTSSVSHSSWARAPRQSLVTLPRGTTPQERIARPVRRTYVANPKNKLDVAVGDIINKLAVNINVEIAAENWKDQSGKYWIGDQDPKLCFCRILRSQTVMVRVGGGWQELSKFIKGHFADSFRLMSDSPSHSKVPEEKWISSSTLLEVAERNMSPSLPPRTPEPVGPYVPSFALSTPNGGSPRSLRSTSSSGSPLMPIQFMRRAEQEQSSLRPVTPTKGPSPSPRKGALPNTPARNVIWRP